MRQLFKTVERQIRLCAQMPNKFKAFLRLPLHAIRQYRETADRERVLVDDDFDRLYGTETSKRIYATSLKISSPNWIHASPYFPTPSQLLPETMKTISRLGQSIRPEEFTFIDLGCGKGRMLLMASQLPFRRILGVEFSPELVRSALHNIAVYKGPQACSNVEVICGDFTEFEFPAEPLFVFLYNPASLELSQTLANHLAHSLEARPREAWVLYVTPLQGVQFGNRLATVSTGECCGHPYSLYHTPGLITSP